MKYYVENRYGTAGMGNSFGYAAVIEVADDDTSLDNLRYDMTRSIVGPYATLEEAKAAAAADNAVHDQFREAAEA